jgi:endoglucanase
MGTYGIAAYLRLAPNNALSEKMKKMLRDECEEIMQKNKSEPYGTSQGTFFRWGSNMDVANNAQTLLLYNALVEPREDFVAVATEHMHYLLGRNPLSQSYITGFGANAAKNPHHRPSVSVGAAFHGMVVGGANNTTPRDTVLQNNCDGNPPSKFYTDHKESFASNEVTIYWNSSVYFVAKVLDM